MVIMIISIAWATIGTVVGAAFANLSMFFLFYGPMVLAVALYYFSVKKWQETLKKAVDMAGNPSDDHVFSDGAHAIIINAKSKELVLIARGSIKKYSFGEIRGWDIVDGSVEHHVVSGRKTTKLNGGLVISVVDINCPRWFIRMPFARQRERWFEILNQAVNGNIISNFKN